MHDVLKIIKVLVLAILIILGLLLLNFYFSFGYGSFGGFLAELRSLPGEEKLASLRGDAIQQLTQAHTEFNSVTGLTLKEETYSDMCAKGEHGWKREDSYAYVCSYRLTAYYGTNRDYAELLLEVDRVVNDLGWKQNRTPAMPTISESMGQHPDDLYQAEFPFYVKEMSEPYPAEKSCLRWYCKRMYLAVNGFNGYGGIWFRSNDEPDPFGFGIGIMQEVYKNASNASPAAIFDQITSSGRDVLMISISKEYFRN
jgi:hypothetical protein